jgi:iron-sulfur cluster repair protein YtfE (RIC family)
MIASAPNVITVADVKAAQERAEEAHQEAERMWQAVEDATRKAQQAEEAASHWTAVANRVRLQVGFRKVEGQR